VLEKNFVGEMSNNLANSAFMIKALGIELNGSTHKYHSKCFIANLNENCSLGIHVLLSDTLNLLFYHKWKLTTVQQRTYLIVVCSPMMVNSFSRPADISGMVHRSYIIHSRVTTFLPYSFQNQKSLIFCCKKCVLNH